MRSTKLHLWTKRILGLQSRHVPPGIFAISSDSLCYGRMVRNPAGADLEEFRVIDLPDATFGNGPLGGPLRDHGALRDQLERLLQGLQTPVDSASLVLPDSWMRLLFLDAEEVGGSAKDREQVIRWKLGKVVPFRTDELRIDSMEVLSGRELGSRERVLVGFGSESFLSQIEKVFGEQGIHIGYISNSSLSLVAGLQGLLSGVDLGLLLNVVDGSFSLVGCRNGVPILHRLKSLVGQDTWDAQKLVLQELNLSRNFLQDQLQEEVVGRIVLVAPGAEGPLWMEWLEGVFELRPINVEFEHLPVAAKVSGASVRATATLIGAAAAEVA